MTDINYRFIGWCHESNHDKVWVAFDIDNDHLYCAWGRRGGKLSFKSHGHSFQWGRDSNLKKIIQQKQDKGYKEVDNFMLFSIFPDFKEKVEEELTLNLLAGKIR